MGTVYSVRLVKRRFVGRYIANETAAQNLDRDVVLLRMLQMKPERLKDMVRRRQAVCKEKPDTPAHPPGYAT